LDYLGFWQLLHDEMPEQQSSAKKQIIRFLHPKDYQQCLAELKRLQPSLAKLNHVQQMKIIHAVSCPLPSSAKLEKFSDKVMIEEDAKIKVHSMHNTSSTRDRSIPWGVKQIKAPQAWQHTTGHQVKVGVIDTGVDYSHPDLRNSLGRGFNVINRHMLPHDDNGHGTHISGTIAAANQHYGIVGVAPRAIVHPVKAFDSNGTAFISDIILGIDWCVRNQIKVINMSFGMKNRSKSLLNAVVNAYNAGSIIVASSGNDAKRMSIDYPARFPYTISVGATDHNRRIAPFSNRGKYIDIYAPGEKILSSWLRGKYNELSGTSMATSHVSGAIALLLAMRPELTPAEIRNYIKRSASPIRGSKSSRSTTSASASTSKTSTGELDVMRLLKLAEK